ncbi:MAG TPA: HPr family phosphocarrier protein [Candidatus Faecousia intestinigallinarum]|nr:HPr family phosphocarrier protein [Candidatus Faecousia intestinigallinarum]
MKSFTHVIKDPLGLHARPAGMLVKAAAAYPCAVTIEAPTGKADAKRIMAVMRLAAKAGMEITVSCDGADEDAACAALKVFLEENL